MSFEGVVREGVFCSSVYSGSGGGGVGSSSSVFIGRRRYIGGCILGVI